MSSTYSFTDVTATLLGPTGKVNLGYGAAVADEGIHIDVIGDKNSMMVGADGRGMHSLHADRSGIVTVRLLKVSKTNSILMAMYDAQSLVSSLWGQNVIIIQQHASHDITTASQCAFKKKPSLRYAKDGDIVEWPFDAITVDSILGIY